jgi:hypothetical protein
MRTTTAYERLRIRRPLLLAVVAMAALGLVFEAGAMAIQLSYESSDPELAAADLAATLDFEVVGSTLTLNVSNDSTDFDLAGIYFNITASDATLALRSGPKDWILEAPSDKNPTDIGAFGVFDSIVWVKGRKADNAKLSPGDVASFTFSIDSAGPLTAEDFTAELSMIGEGEIAALAAGRIGTGKDALIGATHAPEPTTALLVGMGMMMLTANRNRPGMQPPS